MATIEHTVIPHPLPTEALPTNPLARPYDTPDDVEDSQQRLLARLAGISMAVNVLTGLLGNSEAFRDRQACAQPGANGEWPLPPTCVEGLFLAVHYLSRYAESLSLGPVPEPAQSRRAVIAQCPDTFENTLITTAPAMISPMPTMAARSSFCP